MWEVKGQIHFESGQVEEAIAAYGEAVRLKPQDNQLHLGLGRALAARGDKASTEQAIGHLVTAANNGDQPYAYYQLSIAYGQLDNIGMAELSTAQYYDALGRVQQAKAHAGRAMRQLAQGSPEWLRAQDIAMQPMPEKRG